MSNWRNLLKGASKEPERQLNNESRSRATRFSRQGTVFVGKYGLAARPRLDSFGHEASSNETLSAQPSLALWLILSGGHHRVHESLVTIEIFRTVALETPPAIQWTTPHPMIPARSQDAVLHCTSLVVSRVNQAPAGVHQAVMI